MSLPIVWYPILPLLQAVGNSVVALASKLARLATMSKDMEIITLNAASINIQPFYCTHLVKSTSLLYSIYFCLFVIVIIGILPMMAGGDGLTFAGKKVGSTTELRKLKEVRVKRLVCFQ